MRTMPPRWPVGLLITVVTAQPSTHTSWILKCRVLSFFIIPKYSSKTLSHTQLFQLLTLVCVLFMSAHPPPHHHHLSMRVTCYWWLHLRSWSKCVCRPSGPGTEHTRRAFWKVLHLLTRLRWPPISFCTEGGSTALTHGPCSLRDSFLSAARTTPTTNTNSVGELNKWMH